MKSFRPELKRSYLIRCIALALSSTAATPAFAEDADEDEGNVVVISGSPVMRDRTMSTAPELEYSVEFFQQFEPTSAGDMLKRTPGIAFSGDVGEYDAPQMRGLGEGYTQVLINGKKIPGSGSDRAVFVDRIPAEMVESIQIIRSPSADQDSQGVGGTINIILKSGASFEGGTAKASVFRTEDGSYRGSTAFGYGGNTKDLSWTLSANFTQRYVNKVKTEQRFDPESGDLVEDELELDLRDSDDISLSASMSYDLSSTSVFDLSANYLITDRIERQTEQLWEVEDGVNILDELQRDAKDIEEDSFNITASYNAEVGDTTEWETSISYAQVTDVENITKWEKGDYEDPWDYKGKELEDTDDSEILFNTKITHEFTNEVEFKTGLSGSWKDRDDSLVEYDVDSVTGIIEEIDLEQTYSAQENRLDGFALGSKEIFDGTMLELGVRVESTSRTISAFGVEEDSSKTQVNPSAHLSSDFGDNNAFRISIARTVKRPSFSQLAPIIQLDEPEDGDAKQGNPDLDDEVSLGLDIGYERVLSGNGIFGVNVFYRDVADVIEEVGTGVAPGGGVLFSYDNAGDGSIWGLELDLNKPIGDDTAFFANVTFLDSEITDQFTGNERRFREQPNYVYNFGVTHNMPKWESSVGFSYQKQGESLAVDIDREVDLTYDGNLDIFFEKRFEGDYVLRLSGNNLLDAHKIEHFRKFDGDTAAEILDNHINNNIDELETENEKSGPIISLTLRKSF